MSIRNERIAGIIKKNVAEIIQFSVKNEKIGLVSVTDVTVTNDLSFSKIYVRFIDEKDINEKIKILNKAKGFVRSELSKSLDTYKVPEIEFIYDKSLDEGNRIEEILDSIK